MSLYFFWKSVLYSEFSELFFIPSEVLHSTLFLPLPLILYSLLKVNNVVATEIVFHIVRHIFNVIYNYTNQHTKFFQFDWILDLWAIMEIKICIKPQLGSWWFWPSNGHSHQAPKFWCMDSESQTKHQCFPLVFV
jgi:hypothetical protein